MENEINLPFKVGDLAEAKSFQLGYRGAWFRCKIIEISQKCGHMTYRLEYYDFPEEKLAYTRLYQVPSHCMGRSRDKHRELMVRPSYPPIHHGKQMPDANEISEVTVIVHDDWKVGDLVDWWTCDCYWSGRITQLLGDGKALLELKPIPIGEGTTDEILLKDVRPTLDWSPENGWTIPTQEGDTGPPCARLIKPLNQVTDTHIQARASVRLSVSSSSLSASSHETNSTMSLGNSGTRKTSSRADTDPGQTSAEPDISEDLNSSCPPKKYNIVNEKRTTLNSEHSDTLEAAVLDLEEYLNKIKWLKGILESGISSSDTTPSRPKWEYVDPRANPSARK